MSTRSRGLLALTLTLATISLSCGRKEPQAAANAPGAPAGAAAPAAPAPPALTPGISKSLVRKSGAPEYNFDSLGPIQFPAVQKNIQLAGDSVIGISGWAVDPSKTSPAGAVDVVIDGVPYAARYGVDRTDVATHYKRQEYAKSGYELVLRKGQLTKGPHAVSIRVITNDQQAYNEGPVVPFVVN